MLREVAEEARHSLFRRFSLLHRRSPPHHAQQLAITSSLQLAEKGVRARVGTTSKIHTFPLAPTALRPERAHLFPHPIHRDCWEHHVPTWKCNTRKGGEMDVQGTFKGWVSQRVTQGMLGGWGPTTQLPRPQKFAICFICILLDWPNSSFKFFCKM